MATIQRAGDTCHTTYGSYFSRDEAERGIPRYIDRMMQSQAILESRNREDGIGR